MITTDIISEVARIMRQQAATKDAKDMKVHKTELERRDEVELTKAASDYARTSTSGADREAEQKMKVERLKSLVNSGNYKMDEDMVETIAANIAKIFIRK
jgi:anti-sigma28 factor (negative regulator of flagellin synthesis)